MAEKFDLKPESLVVTDEFTSKHLQVKPFESTAEFAEYLARIPNYARYKGNRDFAANHITYNGMCEKLTYGDIDRAKKALEIVKQLENEQLLTPGLPIPETSIIGGMTIMPLYEAGIPTCMLSLNSSHLKGLNSPLTIYYDVYGSIGLSEENAYNRGSACLAFAIAMSQLRPIKLYLTTWSSPYGGLFGALVRIPTAPLDLGRAAWAMTHQAFTSTCRWSAMNWEYLRYVHRTNNINNHFRASDAKALRHHEAIGPYGGNTYNYMDNIKRDFDLSVDDIVLLGTQTTAPRVHNIKASEDPIGWTRAMIKLHAMAQDGDIQDAHSVYNQMNNE